MNQLKWHSGPPPHAGWWLTKIIGYGGDEVDIDAEWRFFDGENHLSFSVPDSFDAKAAADIVKIKPKALHVTHFQWSDHWPEKARVPRIDPRKA